MFAQDDVVDNVLVALGVLNPVSCIVLQRNCWHNILCTCILEVIRIFEQRDSRVAFENAEAVREPGSQLILACEPCAGVVSQNLSSPVKHKFCFLSHHAADPSTAKSEVNLQSGNRSGRYIRALVLANRLDYVDLDVLLGRQWREAKVWGPGMPTHCSSHLLATA